MPMDQSKPNGVPREKLWILPSALEDIDELDHSLQLRLKNDLRKRFFNLEHIATRVMPSLYRIRLGDHHRATVHKEHDQYFIMHIIPKKDDQRYYRSSRLPSHLEMEEARRLPEPLEVASLETAAMTHNGDAVNLPSAIERPPQPPGNNGHATSAGENPVQNGLNLPEPIRDAMQKLQSVFLYFAREQDELLRTIADVSDHTHRHDKSQTEDRLAAQNELAIQSKTLQQLRDQLASVKAEAAQRGETLQRLEGRLTQFTEHFDAAVEIAAGQIQCLEGKLSDTEGQLQGECAARQASTATMVDMQSRLDTLAANVATLQDWKLAFPDLQQELAQTHEQQRAMSAALQTTIGDITRQLQQAEAAIHAHGVHMERTFQDWCQRFDTRLQEREQRGTQTHVALGQSQQRLSEMQSQFSALQTRLEQAERRSFWSWLTGR